MLVLLSCIDWASLWCLEMSNTSSLRCASSSFCSLTSLKWRSKASKVMEALVFVLRCVTRWEANHYNSWTLGENQLVFRVQTTNNLKKKTFRWSNHTIVSLIFGKHPWTWVVTPRNSGYPTSNLRDWRLLSLSDWLTGLFTGCLDYFGTTLKGKSCFSNEKWLKVNSLCPPASERIPCCCYTESKCININNLNRKTV